MRASSLYDGMLARRCEAKQDKEEEEEEEEDKESCVLYVQVSCSLVA